MNDDVRDVLKELGKALTDNPWGIFAGLVGLLAMLFVVAVFCGAVAGGFFGAAIGMFRFFSGL